MTDPLPPPDLDLHLDRLCGRLAIAGAPLDDVARARAEARLEAAVGVQGPDQRRRRVGRMAAAIGLAGVAAAAAALLWGRAGDPPAPVARLEPFVVAPSGVDATAAEPPSALIEPAARVTVPAGWLVRARVGPSATVTVIGPAAVAVTEERGVATLHLDRGRLLGALDGGGGRALRVVTPRLKATLIGTVFAVAADERGDAVAVLRGEVRLDGRGAPARVGGGQRWRTGGAGVEPLDPETGAELAEHAAIAPPREPAVAVALSGEPASAEVWIGATRVARTPTWVRLAAGSDVRVSAPSYGDATLRIPAAIGIGAPARHEVTFALVPVARASREDAAVATTQPATRPARAPDPAPARVIPGEPAEIVSPPAPALPTASDLYRDADAALAAGDRDRARASLVALIGRFPDEPLADAALYELATMAHAAGEHDAALRYLDRVDDDRLAEPAHYLRCRALVDQRAAAAAACLDDFRRSHPRSAHDGSALLQLAGLRFDAGDCAGAVPLLAEYVRRFGSGPGAADARARLDRCAAARPR